MSAEIQTPNPEPESEVAIIDLPRDLKTGLRVGRIVIYGPVGAGKTVLGAALAKEMAPREMFEQGKVLVLSPVPTMANLLPGSSWYKIDPTDLQKVQAFMDSIKEKTFLLIVDEADAYFGGSGRTYGTKGMFGAVNWGRNYCLSMIVISHGSNVTPKNLIGNAQAVFTFRTTEVNLLDYGEEYLQDQIGDEVGDVRYVLSNLPDYTALVYAPMDKEKFVGFAKLNMETGAIDIWRPTSKPQSSEAEETSTTSTPGKAGEGVAGASSAADSSPTTEPQDTALNTP